MTTATTPATVARRRDVPAVREAPVLLQIPDLTKHMAKAATAVAGPQIPENTSPAAEVSSSANTRITAATTGIKQWLDKSKLWMAGAAVVLVVGFGLFMVFGPDGKPDEEDAAIQPLQLNADEMTAFDPAALEAPTITTPVNGMAAQSPATDHLQKLNQDEPQLGYDVGPAYSLGPDPSLVGIQGSDAEPLSQPNQDPEPWNPPATTVDVARATNITYPATDPVRYPDLSGGEQPEMRNARRDDWRGSPSILEPPPRSHEPIRPSLR